jgi:predicted transcriptional regulator
VQLLDAEREVEKAQRLKEDLEDKLQYAVSIWGLLYEKGKPLENAIIDALRMLGLTANPFKETDSEFDVVFESQEGRLIGEAEEKDNNAVNAENTSTTFNEIHEDLQRADVTSPAKPAFFGNAFQLMKLRD